MKTELEKRILRLHKGGTGIVKIGKTLGVGTGLVQRSAARSFYGSVLGWTAQNAATSKSAYSIFNAGDAPDCGFMELPLGGGADGLPGAFKGLSCRLSEVIE